MANIIGYGDQMVKLEAYGDQLVGPVPLSSSSGDLESIYNALVAKGITPASESLSDILTAINTIVVPSGTINITTNGTHDVTNYAAANVNAGITPSGTISIGSNGSYNVTNYATASVNVPDVKHSVGIRNLSSSAIGVVYIVDGVEQGSHQIAGKASVTIATV